MTDDRYKRKASEKYLDAQLKEWTAQIALLKAKVVKADARSKIDYYELIEALELKHNMAKTKLTELKAASNEAWGSVRSGVEKTWTDIKSAYHDVAKKFK